MRYKDDRWMMLWVLAGINLRMAFGEDGSPADVGANQTSSENLSPKDLRGLFSPRMDYDQWKPLGRGDPLKNDPTYDYVPPVLDRVHYWIDPALRKPDPPAPAETQKTEILLLGVSSKKPSTGTSAVADSRKDTYDSFLKFVDGPKFNHHQRVSRPHFTSFFPSSFFPKNKSQFAKNSEQRVPYTMLMPPPMVTVNPNAGQQSEVASSIKTTPGTTTMAPLTTKTTPSQAEVTIQESNLVYHTSSLGGLNQWKGTDTLTPNPMPDTTNKIKPYRDDVVFQQHLKPPESYIQIQFAPLQPDPDSLTRKPLVAANSNINFVTVSPQEIMHKGQVSDDNLDISNTYVKIGKTEAQVHPTAIDNIPVMSSESVRMPSSMMVFSQIRHPMANQAPLTLQTIQAMETMQPPPVTTSPIFTKITNPILDALQKEKVTTAETTTTSDYTTVVTTTPTTTTTTSSLTTDPLFKHYNQPAEPLKGPLYLIIQGHSKVKTYGPGKQIHGIRVQETNEISDEGDFRVRHLHSYPEIKVDERPRKGKSSDLQTLKHVLQTRLGAIDFSEISEASRRQDLKEAELEAGYLVAEDVTSEKYHKGIVEAARKLKGVS